MAPWLNQQKLPTLDIPCTPWLPVAVWLPVAIIPKNKSTKPQKFKRLHKILAFERKKAQFTTVLPFLGNFSIYFVGLCPFCLRKTFEQKYWSRKKVRF